MVLGGVDRLGRHALEDVALAGQLVQAGLDVVGGPEVLLGLVRLRQQATLFPPLGEDDEPGIGRHQDEQDHYALRDEVALCPEGANSVWVVDGYAFGGH